jgi:hypothetical protein
MKIGVSMTIRRERCENMPELKDVKIALDDGGYFPVQRIREIDIKITDGELQISIKKGIVYESHRG